MSDKALELTNRAILNLHEGLSALDGVVEKTGQNTEITRFDFDDKLSWNIAKDLDIVERAAALYQKQRKAKGAKLGVVVGMKLTDQNAQSVAAYQEAEEVLLDQTQTLSGLLKLSLKELQTGNKIPPSVLKNLMPLICE